MSLICRSWMFISFYKTLKLKLEENQTTTHLTRQTHQSKRASLWLAKSVHCMLILHQILETINERPPPGIRQSADVNQREIVTYLSLVFISSTSQKISYQLRDSSIMVATFFGAIFLLCKSGNPFVIFYDLESAMNTKRFHARAQVWFYMDSI